MNMYDISILCSSILGQVSVSCHGKVPRLPREIKVDYALLENKFYMFYRQGFAIAYIAR